MKAVFRGASVVMIFLTSMTMSYGQTDQKAKEILDKLSAKTKAYSTIKADFNYTLDNQAEDMHETQQGTLAIKGSKYYLKIAGQEIRCDGKVIYTYLKDAGEVQISELEEGNNDQITPSSIFTMYEKGFRHKYIKEENINGVVTEIIHIFPLDLDNKSYHTVKLYINKAKMELSKIEIMGKEGDVYTYTIKSFQTNVTLGDEFFVFDKSKYPGVDVIDLR